MGSYFLKEELANQVVVLTLKVEDREMNVLTEAVLRDLDQELDLLSQNKLLAGLVIISGRKDHFIVGADINEIKKFKTSEEAYHGAKALQGIFNKIAKLPCPSVAAINGTCLGGGTELSLACTWRIATEGSQTKIGLPEIQLGLLPGAGGTQRLPRLIGIRSALDIILTGKQVESKKALKLGLVDAVVPAHMLRDIAIDYARKKRGTNKSAPSKSFSDQIAKLGLEGNLVGRKVMQSSAKEMAQKNTKGFYPAAFKAIEAVFSGFELKIEKGLDLEAKLFGELAATKESKSLIHLFDATTSLKKHPYKSAGKDRFGKQKVSLVGVVGAGFMGAGIASVCADRKIKVRLSDPSVESLSKALKQIKSNLDKKVQKRRLKEFESQQRLAHVSPGLQPTGFASCDLVIEAVFEDLNLKQKILEGLESTALNKDWIFASNTSAIPISEIAAKAKNPERILGMHFFSPVEKMPLLEIVITPKTADWVTARCIELGQTLGKQVIVVKDGPGFYTTRALAFFLNEAAKMLEEGNRIESIDRALTDFGFPVGPITLIDEVGIDVGKHVLETMEKAFPDRVKIPESLNHILKDGRLGRKNQKGFNKYQEGEKVGPDDSIYKILSNQNKKSSPLPSSEILERCLLVFINESIRCLEESILPDAYSGDVGAVFGLGFPPFWGGPFKYCDHIGPAVIVDKLNELYKKYGERFKPSNLLVEKAKKGEAFFSA